MSPWRRHGPLTIQLAALALTFVIDLEHLVTQLNFRLRQQARLEVVELAASKKLLPSDGSPTQDLYMAKLPAALRHLSSGGEVRVSHHAQGTSVIFFVKRVGMFDDDNYTGFVYRSGDGMPQTDVEDTHRFTSIEEWAPHWFFVRHT